jgi:ABC-type dipeptide/oligopeptide/nickel transport system permease subunit
MARIDWDIRVTFNNIMVALVSLPLILVFMVLSYQLITTAFVNPEVREDIEAYIAVLGILSGPAYMAISRFFDRWNAEEEEYIESIRRLHKTENDILRAQGQLQEDEESIIIVEPEPDVDDETISS